MSKQANKKQQNHREALAPTAKPEPKINNLESIENKRKEQRAKSLAAEREKFAQWLQENESQRAKQYLLCADNLEALLQKKQANFYACEGEKFSLPLQDLYAAIDGSKSLSDAHRLIFRAAIDAYLKFRGIGMRMQQPEAKGQKKWEPSSVASGASKITSKALTEKKPKAEKSSRRSKKNDLDAEPLPVPSPRFSLKGRRDAPSDPRTVAHGDLVNRLNSMSNLIDDDVDYDQLAPLLDRINAEFGSHELIGELEINDDEYRILKHYFRTVCKNGYESASDSEDFVLDKPCLTAMIEVGKRAERLDYWDTIAQVLYGVDSDKFDEAWLDGAFCRGMLRAGKALESTNRQRALATVMRHAGKATA